MGHNNDKNSENNSLSISIGGENLRILTDESPEYIKMLSDEINYIIDDFKKKKAIFRSSSIPFAYAALELCNKLHKEREERENTPARNFEKLYQIEKFSHKKTRDELESLKSALSEAKRLKNEAEKELAEFIREFDGDDDNDDTNELTI